MDRSQGITNASTSVNSGACVPSRLRYHVPGEVDWMFRQAVAMFLGFVVVACGAKTGGEGEPCSGLVSDDSDPCESGLVCANRICKKYRGTPEGGACEITDECACPPSGCHYV